MKNVKAELLFIAFISTNQWQLNLRQVPQIWPLADIVHFKYALTYLLTYLITYLIRHSQIHVFFQCLQSSKLSVS